MIYCVEDDLSIRELMLYTLRAPVWGCPSSSMLCSFITDGYT